jgi:hypothetical protein
LKPSNFIILEIFFCLLVSGSHGSETDNKFQGTLSATLIRGGTQVSFVFTRKGDLLRIENATNKLEPINVVDLATNKLTIVYPHNTSFVVIDLAKKPVSRPGAPPLPPGFPAPPTLSLTPSGAATGKIGPSVSPPPGFPSPPPQMPQIPVGGSPTGAGGSPALPNPGMPMPPMPMPGMFGQAELKKTDKTKKIHGFDCTLYTVSARGETFEIWATTDEALFPFRLIDGDYLGRRFGPQMLEQQWLELLGQKSLFPIEASLKMEPNAQERLSFKIDKIDKKKIDQAEADKLFKAPENYHEIHAPQF